MPIISGLRRTSSNATTWTGQAEPAVGAISSLGTALSNSGFNVIGFGSPQAWLALPPASTRLASSFEDPRILS